MATVLIKNGTIYDGTGNPPVKSDVLIHDRRIASLGMFHKKQADLTLDATGCAITPGLIEMNFDDAGHSGIFADHRQEGMIRRGVTTVLGGSGGISLAPILKFPTLAEMLSVLERRGSGVNFGTLVGYAAIRRFFTKDSSRDLTLRELESAKKLVSRSLSEGAFGFSTDLGSPEGERVPVREVIELVREAAKFKRVYATHLRHRNEKIIEAVEEVAEISRAAGASVEISHFQPLREFSGLFEKALELIEKESAQSQINFDIFPHPVAAVPIRSFLPEWMRMKDAGDIIGALKDKGTKERILKHFQKLETDGMIIAETSPNLKFLEDRSLADFARNNGLTKARSVLKLVMLTGLKAKIFCSWVDKKVMDDFIGSQRSLLTFGYHRFPGRRTGAGDYFAGLEGDKKFPPEKAIAKATGLVAAKYGIHRRGFVKNDHFADLVIWENWKPKTVVVNGTLSLKDGVFAGKPAGSVLKAGRS
jgi:N-acyl-D-amino-acid deacylase